MQRFSTRALLVGLACFLASCVTNPTVESMDDVFRHQVMFTIPEVSGLTVGSAGQIRPEDPEILVTSIIKLHRLKKVAQWSVKALGVEAIVAEFKNDRPIEDVLAALKSDARIESVQPIQTYDLLGYNDPYFHLQSTVPNHDLEQVHELTTGKDIVVGVVDTGVDREHPELSDRIVFSGNFVGHDQADFDMDEHGTTVAGVISSAANNDLGIVGVAPQSKLMVFKACSQNDLTRRSSCDSFSLLKALVEVLRRQPDVLNLSLSGPEDPLLARLVESAISRGIIVVAAVDHANPNNTFPASTPGVIAVSSAFQFDHEWMPKGGVLAPGTEVLTTTPGATYAFRSGSSMSTAFVSGIAALMKEQNPKLSGASLSRLLHRTSQAKINKIPMVDICQAVGGGTMCAGNVVIAAGDRQEADEI